MSVGVTEEAIARHRDQVADAAGQQYRAEQTVGHGSWVKWVTKCDSLSAMVQGMQNPVYTGSARRSFVTISACLSRL